MTITSLEIKGFQSHKKTKLNFDKGLNIIIGESDTGKTGVLRALNWIVNNRPSGDSFRSHGGGETRACLTTKEKSISRVKDKNRNTYNVGWEDCHSEYASLGQDVPEDIVKFLNLTSINLQTQHDSPFLLGETSGFVAKYLNDIINNKKIDSSQHYIKQKLRKKSIQTDLIKDEIKENRKDLKTFTWIKEVEINIIEAEKIENIIADLETKYDFIVDNLESIDEIKRELKEHNKILKYEGAVEEFFEICSQVEKKRTEYAELSRLLINIDNQNVQIKKQSYNKRILMEKLKEITPLVCPLCGRGCSCNER